MSQVQVEVSLGLLAGRRHEGALWVRDIFYTWTWVWSRGVPIYKNACTELVI